MDDNHILQLNPYRLLRCLGTVLDSAELQKITDALHDNVRQLVRLAEAHLRFARHASGRMGWRQRASRGYYCCYCASRALRLFGNGYYNTDSDDHKKIGNLPDGFPNKDIWADVLTKFRGDRNLADYDHTSTEKALELSSATYLDKASDFLRETKSFLSKKSIS
jgi:hypothetical protein